MHCRLLDLLTCPACLPREEPLVVRSARQRGDDILDGELACPACNACYAIAGGLADLVPAQVSVPEAQVRYDLDRLAASYLWSHFADLWDDPEATSAYATWARAVGDPAPGPGLDAGCAVGRFTLELASRTGFAVGVDLSRPFVALARKIAAEGGLTFAAPLEGLLTTTFSFVLPPRLRHVAVEFVRADALALPFRRECFSVVGSLNVVDKLPQPLAHLRQCQRVCAAPGRLVVSDPFSWSEEVARPEDWLGGTEAAGPGLGHIIGLLGQTPGWRAGPAGATWWAIRDHANRFERIRSHIIVADKEA